MTEILDWTPADLRVGAIKAALTQHEAPIGSPDTAVDHLDDPGFFKALGSSFLRNTTLGWLGRDLYQQYTRGDEPETYDPNFNPYAWVKQNVDPETQEKLKDLGVIQGGLLDDALSPSHTAFKIRSLLQEGNLIKGEDASFWGSLLGAAADPLNFVPGPGWWSTGSKIVRMGGLALHAAALAGTQEAVLWSTQDLRDWRESLLNVGSSALLGGGIGMFSRGIAEGHPLNPATAANPFHPENLGKGGVIVRSPGAGEDVIHWQPSTVGAAQTPLVAPSRLGEKLGPVGRAIFGWTPAGRTLNYDPPEVRDLLVRMNDLHGVLTDTNQFGIATAKSAEDFSRDFEQRWINNTLAQGDRLITSTSQALGDIGAPKLNPADFSSVTQKLLTDTWTPADLKTLEATYGPQGAQRVLGGAQQYKAVIDEVHADQAREMKAVGAIRDDQKAEALKKQLDTVREQRKTALEAHATKEQAIKAEGAQAVKAAETPVLRADANTRMKERLVEHEATGREIRRQFDEQPIKSALDHELGLAPDMGKDYGHAQLWEPSTIANSQAEFRQFLREVLIDKPDEGWLLDAHGLTPSEFEALKVKDIPRADAIREEWAGDSQHYRLTQLEDALEQAQRRAKRANLDYNDTLRQQGLLRADEAQARVTEAAKFRDAFQKRLETARAERDQLANEQRALVEAATAARQQTLDRGLSPFVTPEKLAAQAARAQEVARQLFKADTRLKRLEAAQQRMEGAYQDAAGAHLAARGARQALDDAAGDIRRQRGLSEKNVGQLKRALRGERGSPAMEDVIGKIVQNLMGNGRLPQSALEAVIPESGRMKARRLVLTREQKIAAGDKGWLRTDLPHILETEGRQIGGQIGLRKALDIGHGRTFQGWGDVENYHNAAYQRLKDLPAPKGVTPERHIAALENQRLKSLRDLRGLKDRVLHNIDPGADRDGWIMWVQRKMREFNFIRYGATMAASSIPDVGAFALNHRVLPMLAKYGKEAFRQMKTFEADTDWKRFLSSAELGIHGSLLSRRASDFDEWHRAGIGTPGSVKHSITSKIDRVGEGLADMMARWSLLPQWDRFWKIISGMETGRDIADKVGRYDSLSKLDVTRLASLGVGEVEARRIDGFMKQFAEVDPHTGHWDPNFEKWYETQAGRDAATDVRIAVSRDMDRTRFWPGIGTRPLIMDKWWGKLLGQFQSFMFAFTHAYLQPMLQRAVHFHDMQTAVSFATLMVSGAITMAIKDLMHGKDPAQRYADLNKGPKHIIDTGAELMDRSMLLGHLSPYVDTAVKLSGLSGMSRYEGNDALTSLLGANASLVGDVLKFGKAASTLDKTTLQKAIALAPFSGLLRMGHHLYYGPPQH